MGNGPRPKFRVETGQFGDNIYFFKFFVRSETLKC